MKCEYASSISEFVAAVQAEEAGLTAAKIDELEKARILLILSKHVNSSGCVRFDEIARVLSGN